MHARTVALAAALLATCVSSSANACGCAAPRDKPEAQQWLRSLARLTLIVDATVIAHVAAPPGTVPLGKCDARTKPWRLVRVHRVLGGQAPGAGPQPTPGSVIAVRSSEVSSEGGPYPCSIMVSSCALDPEPGERGVYPVAWSRNAYAFGDVCAHGIVDQHYGQTRIVR
jgi:hypothetical protein